MSQTRTWRHSRKGLIQGVVLERRGEWLEIHIENQPVHGARETWNVGDIVTVRESFLTEVKEDK